MSRAPTPPFRILLVDDHAAFRQALALYLATQPEVATVLQAGTGAEARAHLSEGPSGGDVRALVILLDLHLGDEDGVDLIPELLRFAPKALVVVLSAVEDLAHLGRSVEAGASALLSKHASIDEIVAACRKAATGTLTIEPALAVRLMRAAAGERQGRAESDRVRRAISPRELEVLRLMAAGESDREIAEELHIAYETVRTHVANVRRKLPADNRLGAILTAIRTGLITLD